MSLRMFIAFLVLASVAIVLGVRESTQPQASLVQQKWLTLDTDALQQIRIEQAEQVIEITQQDERWLLTSYNHYPVDTQKLIKWLNTLTEATIAETKTANPERHQRLGLQPGTKITLNDGMQLHAFILGDASVNQTGSFVRREGEAQTYLLDSTLTASLNTEDWMQSDVFSMPLEDVTEMSVSFSNGDGFSIARTETEKDEQPSAERDFVLVTPNRDHVLKYESIFTGLVRNVIGVQAKQALPVSEQSNLELDYQASIRFTAAGKDWLLKLFQQKSSADDQSLSWLEVDGQPWLYQIADYQVNQILKPLGDYLHSNE